MSRTVLGFGRPMVRWAQQLAISYRVPLVGVALTSGAMLMMSVVLAPGRGPLEAWLLWDAPHYLSLATYGYQTWGDPANFIVFYPLLPAVIWLVHWFTGGNVAVAGYVVALVASVVAVSGFMALVRLDESPAVARRAVWLLLWYPAALFLHLPYTESLFLALVIGAFLLARRGRLGWAVVLAALATATRTQGLALAPALVVEALIQDGWQWRRPWHVRRPGRLVAAAVVPLLGFGFYLAINQHYFGTPWHFLQVEREHWYMESVAPWVGFMNTVKSAAMWEGAQQFLLTHMQLAAAIAGLVGVVYSFCFLRLSYAVYAAGIWALGTSTGFWVSVPRYMMVMFPFFIMLARWGRNGWIFGLEMVVSVVLFGAYTVMALYWLPVL